MITRHPLRKQEAFYLFIFYLFFCFLGGGEMFINKNEQINGTRAKSQQIVVQDYFHAYNTRFLI